MTNDSANFLTIDIGGLYWHRFFPHEYIGEDGKTYAYEPMAINEAMADFQTWITDRYGDQHADGPVRVQGNLAPQQQQRPAPAQGRSSQSGRQRPGERPLLEGIQCDKCGGPAGRRAKTGKMTSDVAECIGQCKDGRYAHSVLRADGKVMWLDNEDGGNYDGPAPDEPF